MNIDHAERFASLLAVIVIAVSAGCATAPATGDAQLVETIAGPIAKMTARRALTVMTVRIDGAAILLIDGIPSSLDDLAPALRAVADAGGVVRYTRDNPGEEPPPEVAEMVDEVIRAIVEARVAVELVEGGFESPPAH